MALWDAKDNGSLYVRKEEGDVLIGPVEFDDEGNKVFEREFRFVKDGERPQEILRQNSDGSVIIAVEGTIRLVLPPAQPAELSPAVVGVLDLVKVTLDMGVGSMGIVSLDPQIAERLWKLYGIDQVRGSRWQGMEVWQTDMMPGCLAVEYLDTGHIVHLPNMPIEVQMESAEVMNLLREHQAAKSALGEIEQKSDENGEITGENQ